MLRLLGRVRSLLFSKSSLWGDHRIGAEHRWSEASRSTRRGCYVSYFIILIQLLEFIPQHTYTLAILQSCRSRSNSISHLSDLAKAASSKEHLPSSKNPRSLLLPTRPLLPARRPPLPLRPSSKTPPRLQRRATNLLPRRTTRPSPLPSMRTPQRNSGLWA